MTPRKIAPSSQSIIHRIAQNRAARRWAVIGAFVALTPTGALGDDPAGQASIIDGDTLEIHGARIRLWGMDAPESSQLCRGADSLPYRCGAKAANDLDNFIAGRPVSCVPISLDQYGRIRSTVSISANGWSRMAWLWTGQNTRKGN
jgi:endonuclease YncB( thermonuclease family)